MKKYLLATTAAFSLILTPMAFAQDASDVDAKQDAPIFHQEPFESVAPADGFYSADPSQILATRFIGANIHSGVGEAVETVGDVNDIIMTPDGRAVAVIAGVGGFLGIGEKEVAVSMDELTWMTDADGNDILVGDFTKAELENAPAFDRNGLTADHETAELPADKSVDSEMKAAAEIDADHDAISTELGTDNTVTASTPRMETTPIAEAQFQAGELLGMTVIGANDETVGEVSDVLVDDGGQVEAFIIDVGGFLGINEKPVAVSIRDLQLARAEGDDNWKKIRTGLTKEVLENQAAYSESTYEAGGDAVILVAPVE